jgi:hypothetical protein
LAVGLASVAHHVTTGGDFRLAVWYPGQALFHGKNPYNIASFQHYYGSQQVEAFSRGWFPVYGPVHLWLGVVFGAFSVKTAAAIWFVLNLAGLAVIALIAVRSLDTAIVGRHLGLPAVMAVTGILVLSRPGRATLEAGQVTVLYVLLTYVAWSQARKRPWLACVALALALGKPPFGLPLLAIFLVRRLWPVVVRGVALFVVASIPIVIWLSVNAGSLGALWHSVLHNLSYTDGNRLDAPGSRSRIDALSIVARYVHVHFGGGAEVAAFVVLVAVAGGAMALASSRRGWVLSPAVLLVLGTVTLLCIAHEDYDLLLLTWPFAAILAMPFGTVWDRLRSGRLGRLASDESSAREGRAEHSPWGMGVAVLALPALVLSVIPASDTSKLLHLGGDIGTISTLTTASLLLALVGAAAGLVARYGQGGSSGSVRG